MSQSRDELERLERMAREAAAEARGVTPYVLRAILDALDEARRQTTEACEQFAKMRDSRDQKQIERDEARRERDAATERAKRMQDRIDEHIARARRHDCMGADCSTCYPNGLTSGLPNEPPEGYST